MLSFTILKFTENLTAKTIVNDDKSTVCEITILDEFGGSFCTARGYAKYNPSDVFDIEVGKGIAFGRAMEKFGRKYAKHMESLSETPAQRRGRIRVKRRMHENAIAVELYTQVAKKALRRKSKNAPQAPVTPLEAAEVTEVATGTTA